MIALLDAAQAAGYVALVGGFIWWVSLSGGQR